MKFSRRQLFKLGGAASIATVSRNALPKPSPLSKIRWAEETVTICPYCAVGCGMIVKTADSPTAEFSEENPDTNICPD